jgi:hypothetical protein
MAVRNSAVVGVSISQYVLRHVPGFGAGDMDWFIFMPASEATSPDVFV